MILQRAKCLKGSMSYINEDYTDAVRQKRKELMPKLRAARDRGDITFLRHDRLIIYPCSSTPRQAKKKYYSDKFKESTNIKNT